MHLTSDLSPSLTDVTSKISVECIYSFLSSLWVQVTIISGLNYYKSFFTGLYAFPPVLLQTVSESPLYHQSE